jgi:hypothetical protein
MPPPQSRPPARRDRPAPSANLFVLRIGAVFGIVGLSTALCAILISAGVPAWLTGLVTGIVASLLTIGVWSIKEI